MSLKFIHSVWLHHVICLPHSELEQLRVGFNETLQVQTLVDILYGNEIRYLLVYSNIFYVTAEFVQDSFAIDYSDNGTNSRTKEEAIILFWLEYISNCKSKPNSFPILASISPLTVSTCKRIYAQNGPLRT